MHSFSNLRKAALDAYSDSKRQRRRFPLKWAALIGLGLMLVVSGLIVAVAAYSSSSAVSPGLLDLGMLGTLDSLLPGTPTGSNLQETPLPAGQPDNSATLALPSPIPSATPTITPTASPFLSDTPTQTPTITATPTVTLTPSLTPIPSLTLTPSVTPSGEAPPTATFTASPPPTATGYPDCSPSGDSSFESALWTLINAERESEGLPTYVQQSQLQAAARIHSTDMACNGFFSHTGSDGSKEEDRVDAQGYAWTSVEENIYATGDTTRGAPQLAFNFWMASAPNRANILHDELTDIGIGYIHEPDSPFGGYFSVVFARP